MSVQDKLSLPQLQVRGRVLRVRVEKELAEGDSHQDPGRGQKCRQSHCRRRRCVLECFWISIFSIHVLKNTFFSC